MNWRRIALLLVLVLTAAAVSVLLYTEVGARAVVSSIKRNTPVQLDYRAGSIAEGLRLAEVRFTDASVGVSLTDVFLRLDSRCLLRFKLCLSNLDADTLAVRLPDPDPNVSADTEDTAQTPTAFRFPLPLSVISARIGAVSVDWGDGRWQQQQTLLSFKLEGSEIRVSKAEIDQAVLQLPASEANAATQAIQLPELYLPLRLRVDSLSLAPAQILLGAQAYGVSEFRLRGHWQEHRLHLRRLRINAGHEGEFALSDVHLNFQNDWPLQASATVSWPETAPTKELANRSVDVTLSGDFSALQVQAESEGSPSLAGSGSVDVLDPNLPFTAELTVRDAENWALPLPDDLPDALQIDRLHSPLKAQLRGSLEQQAVTVSGKAESTAYGPINVAADVEFTAPQVRIRQLTLSQPDGKLAVDLSGDINLSEATRWSLEVQLGALALKPLLPDLQGAIAGSLQTSGRFEESAWTASLTNVDLHGNIDSQPARLNGSIHLQDGRVAPGSDLSAAYNGAALDLVAATGAQSTGTLKVKIDDLGRWQDHSSGQVELRVQLPANGQDYALSGSATDLIWNDVNANSARIRASLNPERMSVDDLRLTLSSVTLEGLAMSSVTLTGTGDPSQQRLRLQTSGDVSGQWQLLGSGDRTQWRGDLSGSPLQMRLPTGSDLTATIKGKLVAAWPEGGELSGNLSLDAAPLRLVHPVTDGQPIVMSWDEASMQARLDSARLELQGQILGQGNEALQLSLSLPIDTTAEMSGRLNLVDFDIAPLGALLPMLESLSGTLRGELRWAGPLRDPASTGNLTLEDGSLRLAGNPTPLDNVSLQLNARGERATLTGSGTLGGGPVNVKGELLTGDALTLDLTVNGREHKVFYPPSVQLSVSENLRLTMTNDLLDISGNAVVHSGELKFEELPEGAVDLSPDVVVVDTTGTSLEQRIPFAIAMNLGVTIEDGFAITGSLVDSTVSGDLRLRRNPRQPLQLFGSLNTAGGSLRAFDRVLAIKRGAVSFNGNPDNPLVDLRAERHITGSNIVAGVHVYGALENDLSLDVYSDPATSPGDAMSYLIWGRALNTGQTGGNTVVAMSLAGSVVNRTSLVSAINDIPGLSDVAFGAEGDDEDAAATVSGFIGQRLYLSYGFGIYEPINVLTARLFLQTRLWLEVVSRLENSVDLYYSFDIQ
ncbi:MAG: translocation/assembly module TamB domain-containing protein [Pseudomonadota bacterium]